MAEHPEVEFVQISVNPIDWDSELVQGRDCYDVIRKHGRKVVIMEAVKGGGLAKLPDEAEALLRSVHPDWSIASWSVRFCLEKEDVIAVLSGMSTLEQVIDNTRTSNEAAPLTDEEREALEEAMRIYRESAPIPQSQIEQYQGLEYHGVPVTAILQAYSICQIQPDPGFSDDNNYLKNNFAEAEHVNNGTPIECECLKCGHHWKAAPGNLLAGTGCPMCAHPSFRKSHEQYVAELYEVNPDIVVLGTYEGVGKKIDVECRVCGHRWRPNAGSILQGRGCPKCRRAQAARKNMVTDEEFRRRLAEKGVKVTPLEEYRGNQVPILVRCGVCGLKDKTCW